MQLISVMYHNIESEQKYSRGIYPTSPERLEKQIQIIQKKYSWISSDDLSLAIRGEFVLPQESCLLTFDDGLKSQFENAVPILEKYNVPAIFFVPTQHLTSQKAYTIHKVHTLLSLVEPEILLKSLEEEYILLVEKTIDWSMLDMEYVMSWYRYDGEAAAKFKFMVNHYLSSEVANRIIDRLFEKEYSETESKFCESFYISKEELQKINEHPLLSIGLHTHSHIDIPVLPEEKVSIDIKNNYSFLKEEIGVKNLCGISYPFGLVTKQIFDEKIKQSFQELSLSFGFSTDKKVNRDFNEPMILGRFGGNDITGGKRPIFDI